APDRIRWTVANGHANAESIDSPMSLSIIVRWLIAAPLLALFAFFVISNFRVLLEVLRSGLNAGPAPMTLIGGLAGCLALIIMPIASFGERLAYLWVPLIVDLGSAPYYLAMLAVAIWQHLNRNAWSR
ncbi:MAG: hypothetical protein KJO38_02360, partial [Gammaproteobacteria bacterium]|nr:hypothetical protein [Gammaproteobacteria bacterium]